MIRFDSSKESFSMTVDDMCDDQLRVSTDVNETLRESGAIVAFNFIGCDVHDEVCLAFDREQLLEIRSAVDMILTADEAAQSLGKSPSTT